MKNLLVLGSQGTLGHYLSGALSCEFKIVKFTDRIRLEDTQLDQIMHLISSHKINAIINAIGATDINRCEENVQYAFNGNTLVPEVINTLQNLAKHDIHVINFSTDQVYPGLGNSLESEARPLNQYGKSKFQGELKLRKNVCNLRINYVSKGMGRFSFTDWIVKTAKAKEHVTLYKDIFFNPVDLGTLSNCVNLALKHEVLGTYNIGGKYKISKSEFYFRFVKRLGLENPNVTLANYFDINETPRPLDMSMNVEKANKVGFSLPTLNLVLNNLAEEYSYDY